MVRILRISWSGVGLLFARLEISFVQVLQSVHWNLYMRLSSASPHIVFNREKSSGLHILSFLFLGRGLDVCCV